MTDLLVFLRARLDDGEEVASDAAGLGASRRHWTRDAISCVVDATDNGLIVYGEGRPTSEQADHIARHDPDRVLREVAAKRLLLDEHLPQWRTVEWDHDQNGKGEALCCPRCQNAEHSEWNPPSGQATGLPEGFVTPYVLAPCRTLRALALPFDQHPDYDESWRP